MDGEGERCTVSHALGDVKDRSGHQVQELLRPGSARAHNPILPLIGGENAMPYEMSLTTSCKIGVHRGIPPHFPESIAVACE